MFPDCGDAELKHHVLQLWPSLYESQMHHTQADVPTTFILQRKAWNSVFILCLLYVDVTQLITKTKLCKYKQ